MNTDFAAEISAGFDFGMDFDFAAKFDFSSDVDFAAEFSFGHEFAPTKDNNSYNSLFGSDLEFDERYVDESMSRQKHC
jgi:hypothetical protein